VSVSLDACLVTATAGVLGAVVAAAVGPGLAGGVCAGWLCCDGVTGCGKYFFSSGWAAIMAINVTRKISSSRFSPPGSC